MNMRYFRLAATHNETDTGLGIEEFLGDDVVYIASIYCAKKLSKYEALRAGIDHIADLLNGDEATVKIDDARASTPDRLLRGREHIQVKPYRGSKYHTKDLSQDALSRKNTVTETMNEEVRFDGKEN